MLLLPTTLLQHVRRGDTHHDWLIAPPPGPAAGRHAPLWTGRIVPPTRQWAAVGTFLLTPLPPHRRAYLTFQGPLSAGRGTVRRVDQGHASPLLWTESRLILDVRFRDFAGVVDLQRLSAGCWRVCTENPCIATP